jgi:hypothetical protein
MFEKNLNERIRDSEVDLGNEQEKYVSSIKSHENSITLKVIRYEILRRKFELDALYSQLKIKKNSFIM